MAAIVSNFKRFGRQCYKERDSLETKELRQKSLERTLDFFKAKLCKVTFT